MSLDKKKFLEVYRTMRTIRDFEYRVSDEFGKGNIPGFLHLYAGQEAIASGMCAHLTDEDYIVSTHRGHGHCIAKGGDVGEMMKEIMAKVGGSCNGKGGSMHIAAIEKGMLGANAIVGGGPPLIVGAALSCKTLGTDRVGVSFTGDGGSNQGTTFEAMNMAVVLKVPAIFMFENNGYGEGTAAGYAVGSKDIASRAKGFGMPAVKVDGADIRGHFEGDAQQYRGKGEVKRLMEEMDCLKIAREKAIKAKLATKAQLDKIDKEVAKLIAESAEAALAAPSPDVSELLTDVYSSEY
jgi:pyruvate dehydrogenase E1 component alpha subunit